MALATTANRNYPVMDAEPTSYMDTVIIPGLALLADMLDADVQALVDGKIGIGALDTDATMAANSDAKIATQKATRSYIATVAATLQPLNATLTSISATGIVSSMFAADVFDTDATMAANSNTRIPAQSAVKSYVDNAITGVFWKPAVDVATTGNITLSGEQTIDGVLTSGSRVLVRAQSTQTQNGIYLTAAGSWTRVSDADTGFELWGATVMVKRGTLYANTQWTNSNATQPTIGATNITFSQISGAGTYSATGGVILTGNQFSADTGTSGHKLPWLDGANTWSDTQTLRKSGGDFQFLIDNGANTKQLASWFSSSDDQWNLQPRNGGSLVSNSALSYNFTAGLWTFASNLNVTSGSGLAQMTTTGDIRGYRSGGTTGYHFFNAASTAYLGFDGTNFTFQVPGASNVNIGGDPFMTRGATETLTGIKSFTNATPITFARATFDQWQLVHGTANTTPGWGVLQSTAGAYAIWCAASTRNVGIGNVDPTAKLHVTGTIRFGSFGAGTLVTDSSGNVTASSDERLKVMGRRFTRGLADMLKMDDPRFYRWRKLAGMDGGTYVGFGAQGARKGIPETVGKDPRGYLTLMDRPILATHHNAIIELNAMVTKLQREVKALRKAA